MQSSNNCIVTTGFQSLLNYLPQGMFFVIFIWVIFKLLYIWMWWLKNLSRNDVRMEKGSKSTSFYFLSFVGCVDRTANHRDLNHKEAKHPKSIGKLKDYFDRFGLCWVCDGNCTLPRCGANNFVTQGFHIFSWLKQDVTSWLEEDSVKLAHF